MTFVQQLLVAPAALGLLATGVNAAELNINGVSDYAATASGNSLDQVTSVTQFSDVYPTDWAYQALANLVETYGCVAGYPNGTFRGNRAMTRYEAAALLNACLDRVTEVTDELRRLLKEFETELAILKGRVDGLEARVGELEATQFSTTTKLWVATWVFWCQPLHGVRDRLRSTNNRDSGATVFNYDLQLVLETSFTGKDQLTTVLRGGNFGDGNVFGSGGPSVTVWPPWKPRFKLRVIAPIWWQSTSCFIPSPLARDHHHHRPDCWPGRHAGDLAERLSQ